LFFFTLIVLDPVIIFIIITLIVAWKEEVVDKFIVILVGAFIYDL